jgi:hypothetical protein
MGENIFLGDIHGRDNWEQVVEKHPNANTITFVGDYFDSFDIGASDQLANANAIIEFKKNFKGVVNLLIGNHDHHYWPGIGYTGTSGYQYGAAAAIEEFFRDNKEHFSMACMVGNVLCTHAGVSPIFLKRIGWDGESNIVELLNDTFKYRPKAFVFDGFNGYGDDPQQTCIWIRPKSLQLANNDDKVIKKRYIQVVGHTQHDTIDIKGKSTGGRYYYIDTLWCGQYLIEKNGEFSIGKI